jgi:NAD-dependent SIR2 family protein deacetylase
MVLPGVSSRPSLASFLRDHPRLVVLTGAGLSVESGIPTYRDASGTWQRSEPIQHAEFLDDGTRQQRYWARSFMGWPMVRDAQPNSAHHSLNELERQGRVSMLITQNVDRLHQRAGSQRVVDLHGRLDQVICLDCAATVSRDHVQKIMSAANPQLLEKQVRWLPDGDADLPDSDIEKVKLPRCDACAGALMPDVVFFGGSVPRERVERGQQAIEEADAVLAIGSSLQVFSGYRFCRHAVKMNKPLALINPGLTRADDLADVKWESPCAELLSQAVAELSVA